MTDLLSGVPPMPKKGETAAQPPADGPTSADLAIAANLKAMERAKVAEKPAPAPPPSRQAAPHGGRPWWEGRTFYACPCGARDERTREHGDHPDTLPCWQDKCDGTMTQWVPPTVQRERMRHG